jgi:hypothetical protein
MNTGTNAIPRNAPPREDAETPIRRHAATGSSVSLLCNPPSVTSAPSALSNREDGVPLAA